MRTLTAGQLADLAALDRKELLRVKVEDNASALQDLTASFMSGTLSADLNSIAVSGSLKFWREQATVSLSPLVNDAQPIAPGRQVTVEAAVIGKDDSVGAGDWEMLFDGLIDDVDMGGDAPELTVTVRDLGGVLRDRWIEDVTNYGNDSSPVAMATVMQSLLDDTLGSGEVTLNVVGDPDFGIVLYEQQRQSLADALGAHRDLIGWDLRYLWDEGSSTFKLTFYEPDRAKTTADHTFSADDYFSLTEVGQSKLGIRNKVRVNYAAVDLGIVALDQDSIDEFGVQFMLLDYTENNQITTAAQATTLADAIVGDTSRPALTHTSENAFFWPVELGDLYTFQANGIHYDQDQTVAVTGYTHTLDPTQGNTTVIACRGAPAGGTTRWYTKGRKYVADIPEPEDPTPETIASADLVALLTTDTGSAGYTTAQNDADDSLGGYISTTNVPAGLNNLFRLVTELERVAGITLYRAVAFYNSHSSLDWENVYGYLTSLGTGNANWACALDPVGVVDIGLTAKQSAEIADEETAPAGVTFVEPSSLWHADALNVGTVSAGKAFVVWVRLTVAADATAQITDSDLYFTDTA